MDDLQHIDWNKPTKLIHRYFGLRHAESLANVAGIIVSDPQVGTTAFGLSDGGRAEFKAKLNTLAEQLQPPIWILSSDFQRTRETSELLATRLNCEVEYSTLLRERSFGSFNQCRSSFYETVWQQDRVDPSHTEWHVESVESVATRMERVVAQCEMRVCPGTVVLVSHGDPLQILECLFHQRSLSMHRELAPIQPGELRRLGR